MKNLSFSSDTMKMLNKAIEFETMFAQVCLKKSLKSIDVNIKQTRNLIKTCKRIDISRKKTRNSKSMSQREYKLKP